MTTDSRRDLLDKVRQAVAAGNRVGAAADLPISAAPRHEGNSNNLVDQFCEAFRAGGGFAYVTASSEGAGVIIEELVHAESIRKVLLGQGTYLTGLNLPERLKKMDLDIQVIDGLTAEARWETFFGADLGISGVSHAIAETGSVVVASGPDNPRSLTLLPPIHIAVIGENQILPDLFDLFERNEAEGKQSLPACLTLITGPSKTGDIELRLVTGVHGPGKVHAVVIRKGIG